MKKFNVLTTQYIKEAVDKRKLSNEALRAKARKALRRTILALVVTCGSFLLVVVCSILVVKKISAWYDTHTLVVKRPIEVYVKKNKIVNILKREPEVKVVGVEDAQKLIEESGNSDIATMICAEDWNCAIALAIAKCESTLNEQTIAYEPNGTFSLGIFQINSVQFSRVENIGELLTAETNIKVAKAIYDEQGWSPWSCAHNLNIAL